MASSKMEFVKFLGEGSFGSVSLVKYTQPDGTSYYTAMKTSESENYEALNREVQILSKLRGCRRVVQCYGNTLQEAFTSDGRREYRMFLEYASGGSLRSFMEKQVDGKLSDQTIRKFTRMILEGLVSIHSRGYVHCDLKPDNMLLYPRHAFKDGIWRLWYELKISDFGLSREIGEGDDWWAFDSPFWATPLYMSPESVYEGTIGEALDLWSLGCIVLEMYTGEFPWPYDDEEELIPLLVDCCAPKIPDSVPSAARKFLETCFARNPEDRGSASALLIHPFLCEDENGSTEKSQKKEAAAAVADVKSEPPRTKIRQIPAESRRPLKYKIIPPKPPQFKRVSRGPLRLKIRPRRPQTSKVLVMHPTSHVPIMQC